jgi:hypothetical protein
MAVRPRLPHSQCRCLVRVAVRRVGAGAVQGLREPDGDDRVQAAAARYPVMRKALSCHRDNRAGRRRPSNRGMGPAAGS